MFLKPKYDARETFLLWKARLVDGGHMTDPLRYEPIEKTAPTTTLEVVMALIAIVVSPGRRSIQSRDSMFQVHILMQT